MKKRSSISGGGVYVNNGESNMYRGTIIAGYAGEAGGSLYVNNETLVMESYRNTAPIECAGMTYHRGTLNHISF